MARGHNSREYTAPLERVYNPGCWAIHEPALGQAVEELGKGVGCNWEDTGWTLPPLPVNNGGGTSDTTDTKMPTMEWDDGSKCRVVLLF